MMDWTAMLAELARVYRALDAGLVYEKRGPADEEQLAALEERVGPLPPALRQALGEFSRSAVLKVDFSTAAQEHLPLTAQLRKALSGARLVLSLDEIAQAEALRRDLAENIFTRGDAYDEVWQDKLAFMRAAGDDLLAIDPQDGAGAVVYLSANEGPGHGVRLADDFADFLDRYLVIGAVGPEDRQWLPFCGEDGAGLQPDSENAYLFREAIGLYWDIEAGRDPYEGIFDEP